MPLSRANSHPPIEQANVQNHQTSDGPTRPNGADGLARPGRGRNLSRKNDNAGPAEEARMGMQTGGRPEKLRTVPA